MRICLICVEIFAWGKYGGFGRATRIIGRELVKRGVEVYAVVPQRREQKPVEYLDGITVLGFPKYNPWIARGLFKKCNADIYHSQEPSFSTYLAVKTMPDKKHVVTFRDPRDSQDWITEFKQHSLSKLQVISNFLYENNLLVKKAVYKLDGRFIAAKSLISKAQKLYSMTDEPEFLPTPVAIPETIVKASSPTVCFISRWDRRKRPEIFFKLAKLYPDVRFIATGRSRDGKWDSYLREKYSSVKNLEMQGFVNQFNSNALSDVLGKSWILINTASREGLPNAFIEAAAHKCAILSSVNPDEFASRFGYHVKHDRFYEGLKFLFENDRWKYSGELGSRYVRKTFELDYAIDLHLKKYREVLTE